MLHGPLLMPVGHSGGRSTVLWSSWNVSPHVFLLSRGGRWLSMGCRKAFDERILEHAWASGKHGATGIGS